MLVFMASVAMTFGFALSAMGGGLMSSLFFGLGFAAAGFAIKESEEDL